MGSTQAFINQQLPAARAASAQLGIPVSVVLAQWINETGSGSSQAFTEGNNYAGVSYLDQPEINVGASLQPGLAPILSYPTEAAGVAGYIARWLEPVYGPTLAIAKQTQDPLTVAKAVEASPWAAGHYGGNGLENLIVENNLTAYDNPSVDPGATFVPAGSTSGSSPTSSLTSVLDPLSGLVSWLQSGLVKVAVTIAVVGAGLVLIIGGFLRAAAPRAREAAESVAPVAAAAAV